MSKDTILNASEVATTTSTPASSAFKYTRPTLADMKRLNTICDELDTDRPTVGQLFDYYCADFGDVNYSKLKSRVKDEFSPSTSDVEMYQSINKSVIPLIHALSIEDMSEAEADAEYDAIENSAKNSVKRRARFQ